MNDIYSPARQFLIIEDDAGDFGLVRAHMRMSGLVGGEGNEQLIWAKTLSEGMAAAARNKPDIVLLDLSLPDSAGLDTVRAMRAALPDVPIVILTGHDDSSLDITALEAGAQDYLVKGQFEHNALGRAVRHALVRGALEQELARKNRELQTLHEKDMDDRMVAKDLMDHIMKSRGLDDPQFRYYQRPAQQFSGDFIASSRDSNGDLRVFLGDATGHGLQAALFLLPTFKIFQTMTQKGLSIKEIVSEINKVMREFAFTGRFIAAAIAHIARDGSFVEIWNGGIPTAVLIRKDGGVRPFRSQHLPLGIVTPAAFDDTTEVVQAQEGVLLLATDGLVEAENASGKSFGEKRLEVLLQPIASDTLIENILAALEAHLDGAAAHDDLSIVLAQCGA